MAEVTLGRRQVWEVRELGIIGQGDVVHGVFDDEAEAWARYDAVLRQQPGLGMTGSLQVRGRLLEVVEIVSPERQSASGAAR